MTQEERQLLLRDLCARLPYGVYVRINEIHCLDKNEAITEGFIGGYCKPNMCQDFSLDEIYEFLDEGDDVKLYLRPMSSMTDEEQDEYDSMFSNARRIYCNCVHYDTVQEDDIPDFMDWLLEHHFDHRGLIPMGLAIEAPEDMYKK